MEANPIQVFFNFNEPCPKEIPLCRDLREKYRQDIEQARLKSCKKCEITSIQAKYTTVVWEQYMEYINSRNTK